MRQYLQKIATGPELSKDLSREEAKNAAAEILSGDADPVQAGIFLIALRMKRETMPENLGVLDSLLAYTHRAVSKTPEVLDLADPYDGFTRGMPAAPFLPTVLAACGVPTVSNGAESVGPKYGATHRKVLQAAGYRVHAIEAQGRPLCCGRTYLSVGMVDEARAEIQRTVEALKPYIAAGVPVVGLEPACLLTLRDEFHAVLPGADTQALSDNAFLLEEFLARELDAGRLALDLKPLPQSKALLHGHCHQKSFGAVGSVQQILALVPGLKTSLIDSSCCGMAGSFGYDAKHWDVSQAMAEASLLPAVREADAGTLIVADGTSCRHQIKDGAGARPLHVAEVLAAALA